MDRSVKRTEWDRTLRQPREEPGFYGGPAHGALLRLLTLCGRVPYRSAAAGLTDRELALLQHLLGRDEFVLVAPDDPDLDRCNVLVAQSGLGQLTLHEPDRGDEPPDDTAVAGLRIPHWLLEMVDEECAALRAVEEYEQAQLDALLDDWARDGSLPRRLEQCIDWVDRVETVLVYVGRRVFSKTDGGSNTLVRGDALTVLRGRALESWSTEERLFVAAVQLLFLTGRAVRFEEFNGRQLSAVRLRQLLVRRCCAYLDAVGETPPPGLTGRSFLDLASMVRDLVPRVDEVGPMRYRRINGVSYVKDEFLLSWDLADRRPRTLSPALRELARDGFGRDFHPDVDPVEAVAELAVAAARSASASGDSEPLARLLETIVYSAVVETGSDYGMSSGIRRLGWLRGGSREEIVTAMLALKKPHFFCCVVPGPQAVAEVPTEGLSEILWAVAQRMMYNRWHFVPGNFEREEVPGSRHYFFPPLVPDIAEWADLRHGGHVSARVRYSIRAPGAQMWREPFSVSGHPYRGSYDIRLVRMSETPYDYADLKVASRYCTLVDAYWRALGSVLESDPTANWELAGFDRDWYQGLRWRGGMDAGAIAAAGR